MSVTRLSSLSKPAEILKALGRKYGRKRPDPREGGNRGIVSKRLIGRRALNIRQINQLSQRFDISLVVSL
jgi:antitoxin component HigA of HigAB toxin-antitoxin module